MVPYHVSVELDGSARGRVDGETYIALAARVLAAEGVAEASVVGLLFADDELIWRLNREHRGRDEPTDVLSFPAADGDHFPDGSGEQEPPYLGDIAISVQTARGQAEDASLTVDQELAHLVVHGILHLLGYDHEQAGEALAMRAREEAFLGVAIHAGGVVDGH